MKYLLSILCLFVLSCDDDDENSSLLSGCNNDTDYVTYENEEYNCGDLQVLQDIIDDNEEIETPSGEYFIDPLWITSNNDYNYWIDGRLIVLDLSDLVATRPSIDYSDFDIIPNSIKNLTYLEELNFNHINLEYSIVNII